jgi:hypothetical protein
MSRSDMAFIVLLALGSLWVLALVILAHRGKVTLTNLPLVIAASTFVQALVIFTAFEKWPSPNASPMERLVFGLGWSVAVAALMYVVVFVGVRLRGRRR